MRKMCLMSYANNKGADQPAHPRSLISAFVVRCLDIIIVFFMRQQLQEFGQNLIDTHSGKCHCETDMIRSSEMSHAFQ